MLLLICFVLPLSRCTAKADVDGQTKATDTYLYGYTLAQEAWTDVKSNGIAQIGGLLVVVNVFFLPVICLAFKERLQAAIYFLASFVSAYFLYCWIFVFATSPQIGGIIAIICWLLLFATSCITLCELCRGGAIFRRD